MFQRIVSDEHMMRARSLFTKYDEDRDGMLNQKELGSVFEEMGGKPSPALMKKLDPDGNGKISFIEFINSYEIWAELLVDNKGEVSNYKGSRVNEIN